MRDIVLRSLLFGFGVAFVLAGPAFAQDRTKLPEARSAVPSATEKAPPTGGKGKPALSPAECTALGGTIDRKSNGAAVCESGAACVTTDEQGGVHAVCLSKAVAD